MVTRMTLWMVAGALALGQTPAFEVASVKPATPGDTGAFVRFLPAGRFSADNVPLNYLLEQTYQLRDFQIVGDPRWMAIIADGYAARYMIEAKGDASADEAQVREMLKALLADRFALKVHKETRELPVYALIPAKTGIKLQGAKDNGRPRGSGGIGFMVRGWIQGNNVVLPSLISALSEVTDRPVVDKTGFSDAFDFRLTWTPDTGTGADAAAPTDGSCPSSFTTFQEQRGMKVEIWSCPSIFTAVQDQLGLKLDPQKDPTEVLVIDHVEHPSAN
jgi:uncharacterized protein (TIGR03435 family)